MQGLNDNDMLTEITRELTKAKESVDITSEQVLDLAKRVATQRVQSAIMDSLTKTKEFDQIRIAKGGFRYNGRNVQTCAKAPAKKSYSYCCSSHHTRQCPAYGKKCMDCGKMNHFREVCRSRRSTAIHNIEQVPDQCKVQKDHIDMVNINSVIFNKKQLAITANLKTSSNQNSVVISYKADTGSDDNIIP